MFFRLMQQRTMHPKSHPRNTVKQVNTRQSLDSRCYAAQRKQIHYGSFRLFRLFLPSTSSPVVEYWCVGKLLRHSYPWLHVIWIHNGGEYVRVKCAICRVLTRANPIKLQLFPPDFKTKILDVVHIKTTFGANIHNIPKIIRKDFICEFEMKTIFGKLWTKTNVHFQFQKNQNSRPQFYSLWDLKKKVDEFSFKLFPLISNMFFRWLWNPSFSLISLTGIVVKPKFPWLLEPSKNLWLVTATFLISFGSKFAQAHSCKLIFHWYSIDDWTTLIIFKLHVTVCGKNSFPLVPCWEKLKEHSFLLLTNS